MKKALSIAINIALIGFYTAFIATRWDLFRDTLNVKAGYLSALAILVVLTWLINAVQLNLLLNHQNVRIGVFENFLLVCVSTAGNYLPFKMGTLYRMRYMKTRYRFDYMRFGSFVFFRFVLLVFVTGSLGMLCLVIIALSLRRFDPLLFSLMLGLTLAPLGLYLLQKHRSLLDRLPWLRHARMFEAGKKNIDAYVHDGTVLLQTTGLMLAQIVLVTVRFYISFRILGMTVPFVFLLLMSPLATLATLAAVTPGGLGLRESLIGIVSTLTGFGFDKGLYMATVDRGVLILCALVLGTFSYVILSFNHRKRLQTTRDN